MGRRFSNSPVLFSDGEPVVGPLPDEAPTLRTGRGREVCWMLGLFLAKIELVRREVWYSNHSRRAGLVALAIVWCRVFIQGIRGLLADGWQRRHVRRLVTWP
jgi:hypothetical protein